MSWFVVGEVRFPYDFFTQKISKVKSMKRIFFSILFVVVLTVSIFPQFTNNATTDSRGEGLVVRFDGTIDSVTTLFSKTFSLNSYDDESFYSYPLTITKAYKSVSGVPKVTTTIQGSIGDSAWVTIDTIGAVADSSELTGFATYNLNNAKYPDYRIVVKGEAKNRKDTSFRIRVWAFRKDK